MEEQSVKLQGEGGRVAEVSESSSLLTDDNLEVDSMFPGTKAMCHSIGKNPNKVYLAVFLFCESVPCLVRLVCIFIQSSGFSILHLDCESPLNTLHEVSK